MANTYTLISSVTVGSGGAANIEFTSIPNTYTDLKIVFSLRDASNTGDVWDWLDLTFNSNTSNYSARMLYGTGSATGGTSNTTQIKYGYYTSSTATASTFGNGEIYIPNYLDSNYKSILGNAVSENNATAAIATLQAGLWSNSSTITSVKLTARISFAQYSTAYLYGISKS
jgi:hypothetical protein